MKYTTLFVGSTLAITQSRFSDLINQIQSPADLEEMSLLQTGWGLNNNKIYDADGDGVEDNVKLTSD